MFWSGADFGEDNLKAGTGKFKDASIRYTSTDQINLTDLKRWLKKSREIRWDYKNVNTDYRIVDKTKRRIMITLFKIIFVGIGATLLVDYVGRWIAHFPKGKFVHDNILTATPVRGETITGWVAHYFIGITFAFLLILLYGKEWLIRPLFFPALAVGIVTVIAPLFIMQPAFGFGIASSKLPKPNVRRLKSLSTHAIYGMGLYVSALLISQVWN